MEARVRKDYRWNTLVAFSGKEYIKSEFRPVPLECETAALADERLEVREGAVKPVVEEVQKAETTFENTQKKNRKPKFGAEE